MTVVPISGLMAETSHTGALTEVDARTLAELGGFAPFDLIDLIESDDTRYLTAQQRDRLVDLLGEYGIIHGRQIAARGAAALNEWLADNSGIRPLRQILHNSVAEFASVHRAQRILLELKNLAYSHPARDHIRGIVHQVREDPAMQPIVLFVALRSMLEADPRSPVAAELRRLLQGRTVAEKLGLPPEHRSSRFGPRPARNCPGHKDRHCRR